MYAIRSYYEGRVPRLRPRRLHEPYRVVITSYSIHYTKLYDLLVLSRYSGDFIPKIMNEEDKVSFAVTGLIMGFLGGGILEETGWTGFALPALRKRYGVFKSGLILGLV